MLGCELGFNQRGVIHWPDTHLWDTALMQIRGLGGSVIRAYVGYSDLSPDIAAGRLASFLERAAAHNVRVIATLADYYLPDYANGHWYTPQGLTEFYTGKFNNLFLLGNAFFHDGYRGAYLDFVRTVVERNAGHSQLYSWEPGNELQSSEMVPFMKTVSETIRALDPATRVSAGVYFSSHALNRGEPQQAADLYAGLPHVDYATIHYYPESEFAAEANRRLELEQARQLDKQIIVEELGVPWEAFVVQAGTTRLELLRGQLAGWAEAGAAAILMWGWPLVTGKEDQYIRPDAPDYPALIQAFQQFGA